MLTNHQLRGLRLRAAREAIERSQADVCRAIEVDANRWNQYERGGRRLDHDVLAQFCDTYGVTTDWVLRGRPEGMPPTLSEAVVQRYRSILPEAEQATANTA